MQWVPCLSFMLFSITCFASSQERSQTIDDDLNRLVGKGIQKDWQLQLDESHKKQGVKSVTLRFFKPEPKVENLINIIVEHQGGISFAGVRYHLESSEKKRYLICKGEVLGMGLIKVQYQLNEGLLNLESGVAKVKDVGEVRLKGKWN